jgi:GTP-binding protein
MNVTFITSAFKENQYPQDDLPEIAFAGRSNVGKSSLINVLVNRKGLARTSSRPGRTQSLNFFMVNGNLFLVDLPGYGFARVPVSVKQSWQRMVESYLKKRGNLRAVVVIMDIRRGVMPGDADLLAWLRHYDIPVLPVLTKTDKLSRQQALKQADKVQRALAAIYPAAPELFSAKTRAGRDRIWARIAAAAGLAKPGASCRSSYL